MLVFILGIIALCLSLFYNTIKFSGQNRQFQSSISSGCWYGVAFLASTCTSIILAIFIDGQFGIEDRNTGLGLCFFFIAVDFPLILNLPKLIPRNETKRTDGKRKNADYQIVLTIFWIIVALFALFFLSSDSNAKLIYLLELALASWAMQRGIKHLIRRQKQPTIEEKMTADPRPPILYLRSFATENDYFFTGSRDDVVLWIGSVGQSQNKRVALTYAQFFTNTLEEYLGPLVGLGNPEDWMQPEGVYATYYKDKGWEAHVEQLMDSAAMILIQIGDSANLHVELDMIVRKNLFQKVVIFTPPEPKSGILNKIDKYVLKLMDKKMFPWANFAQGLTRAGFQLPDHEPAPGSVIVFNEKNVALYLEIGAETPRNYVYVFLGDTTLISMNHPLAFAFNLEKTEHQTSA